MAETHVISALSKKRGEILSQMRYYNKLMHELDADLKNVDATIKLFEPNFDFGTTKIVNRYSRNSYFQHGEAKILILNTIREYKEPANAEIISSIIALKKELSFEDKAVYREFKKIILNNLKRLQKDKILEQIIVDGVITWSIIEYKS